MSSAEELPIPQGASAGEVVLVVEDEEAVRIMLHRLLESEGYQVLEAADGQRALAAIDGASRVDLVITDVAMPALNGRQLADRLKVLRPRLPVLFMSGYTDDEMMRSGIVSSEVRFVQKPFEPAGLARAVRDALDASPGTQLP